MRRLNLDHLAALSEVARLGNFSAAAKKLNLTQPAVSMQIKLLEQHLGVRLIERIGRRAVPTLAGENFLAHVQRIDSVVNAALDAMTTSKDKEKLERIRLASGATACIYLLPAILRELRNKYPSLEISVRAAHRTAILSAIEENELDFGLVTLPVRGRMFVITPLVNEDFYVIEHRNSARLPRIVTPGVLIQQPVVVYDAGGDSRSLVDSWFRSEGLRLRPAMALNSVEAIKEMVAAGLGCAILPAMAVRKDPGPFNVHRIKPPLVRQLGIIVKKDKVLSQGMKDVIRAISAIRLQQQFK